MVIFEDDEKEKTRTLLPETSDVKEVLGVEIEYDKVTASVLEDGWDLSIVVLVNKASEIGSDEKSLGETKDFEEVLGEVLEDYEVA